MEKKYYYILTMVTTFIFQMHLTLKIEGNGMMDENKNQLGAIKGGKINGLFNSGC